MLSCSESAPVYLKRDGLLKGSVSHPYQVVRSSLIVRGTIKRIGALFACMK